MSPKDIADLIQGPPLLSEPGFLGRTGYLIKQAWSNKSLLDAIPDILDSIQERWANRPIVTLSKQAFLVQHYLFQSQSE